MAFLSIQTANFRNLGDAVTDIGGKDIFLVGENGQGKTNFLEALYFCSYASSFRGVRDSGLVKNGEKDCSVSVKLAGSCYNGVRVSYKDSVKIIRLDEKRVEDRKELLSVIPVIIFCHEDMEFVSGPPERRRWFFDQSLSLNDPLYLDDLRRYRQVLKTRNTLLRAGKDGGDPSLLDVLDPQLVHYGLDLMKKRAQAAAQFSLIFEPLFREVSGLENMGIHYHPSWKEEEEEKVIRRLEERREGDYSFGLTLSGPHRDRYVFIRRGKEFAGNASTGQRRLLALLLRLAQVEGFSKKTGYYPVLLLDDVLLELDREKRRKFLAVMPNYDQAFYTFLPGEPYEKYQKPDTIVYNVTGGILRPGLSGEP
jgi:DNA replication and repair protein RecF